MSVRAPLTLIERAKVAAAIGATVEMQPAALIDLCEIAEGVQGIRQTLDTARTEARELIAEGARRQAEAAAIQARAEAALGRARRHLRVAVVFAGIGLGAFIAGLIL